MFLFVLMPTTNCKRCKVEFQGNANAGGYTGWCRPLSTRTSSPMVTRFHKTNFLNQRNWYSIDSPLQSGNSETHPGFAAGRASREAVVAGGTIKRSRAFAEALVETWSPPDCQTLHFAAPLEVVWSPLTTQTTSLAASWNNLQECRES